MGASGSWEIQKCRYRGEIHHPGHSYTDPHDVGEAGRGRTAEGRGQPELRWSASEEWFASERYNHIEGGGWQVCVDLRDFGNAVAPAAPQVINL